MQNICKSIVKYYWISEPNDQAKLVIDILKILTVNYIGRLKTPLEWEIHYVNVKQYVMFRFKDKNKWKK